MSAEDHCIFIATTVRPREPPPSPARGAPLRATIPAGSSRYGSPGTYALPDKLIEAWARWAASRLS